MRQQDATGFEAGPADCGRDELRAFPDGHYDDQVDALLLFLDWFAENKPYLRPIVFCEPIVVRRCRSSSANHGCVLYTRSSYGAPINGCSESRNSIVCPALRCRSKVRWFWKRSISWK